MEQTFTQQLATIEQAMEEASQEISLRPQSLDDFIGQPRLLADLRVFVEAAKIREKPLGHMMFSGPPGLGKTSLAGLLANEMGTETHTASGLDLTSPHDVVSILSYMEDGDLFVIDEAHNMSGTTQDALLTATEDYYIDVIVGGGATAKPIRVALPRFTLVLATTETGRIKRPLRERLKTCHLELYDRNSLQRITLRAAASMGWIVTDKTASDVARRGRGTPRKCIEYLKGMDDYATVLDHDLLDETIAEMAFDSLGVDSEGLEERERRLLTTLLERFQGGPVGIKNICAVLGESNNTVEEIEAYCIQSGMLIKMHDGRMVTAKARKHLGYEVVEDVQQERRYGQ